MPAIGKTFLKLFLTNLTCSGVIALSPRSCHRTSSAANSSARDTTATPSEPRLPSYSPTAPIPTSDISAHWLRTGAYPIPPCQLSVGGQRTAFDLLSTHASNLQQGACHARIA